MRSSWIIALALSLALGAWLASPYVLPAKEAEAPAENEAASAIEELEMTVQTKISRAEPVRREVILNGRSEAARRVILRAEVDGRVIELPVEQGQSIAASALVANLDQRDKQAWVTRAQAMLREREIEYEAARKLGKKGFQSETKVAQTFAQLEEAKATLEQSRIEFDNTSIRASFAGILEERHVEVGDFVQKGDPIAEVVELDPIVVTADVPETHYHRFSPDSTATVTIPGFDERQGRIKFLASEADEETRTFRVEVELANPDLELPAGITSEVVIAFEEEAAHKLSASLLTLDDSGRIGIKTVDPLGVVAFASAEIVKTDATAIWLAGLPPEIEVITIGQGFVKPSEKVVTVREEAADEPADLIAKK